MISHKLGLLLLSLVSFSSVVKSEVIKDCDIVRQAKSYGAINPTLVLAISQVESSGNSKVVSRQGRLVHYGIMQMQLGTARMLGFHGKPSDLLQWKLNLQYGVSYLNEKLKKYHSKESAVAAYNAGAAFPCKRSHHGKCKLGHFVNQGYVDLVMSQYKRHASLQCDAAST